MAACKSCGAPLAANTNICQYCGVRNDVDLQSRQNYTVETSQSERICPNCHTPLQTIDLKVNGHLYIERCDSCFGLFFDPGEIEELLENSVSGVYTVNLELLDHINEERYPADQKVKYVKCPVCQVLMNRVNFGYRSGVVVDRCRAHGVWLDSGEITHLMEWKKAGGQILNDQQKLNRETGLSVQHKNSDYKPRDVYPQYETDNKSELLVVMSELVFNLFK